MMKGGSLEKVLTYTRFEFQRMGAQGERRGEWFENEDSIVTRRLENSVILGGG